MATILRWLRQLMRVAKGKRHSEKRMDLHPLAGHALEKAAAHAYRAYIVVDHPHGHSLPGFLDQEVGHALAELIVFKYVVLHRHTLAGGAYVGHKAFKFFLSRSKDLYTRVGYEAGVAYVGGHHGRPRVLEWATTSGSAPSGRRVAFSSSLLRALFLRREIMRVFLIERPKNM